MDSDPMDDVDRLFDCFKCGISTPPSAVISSRKKRRKMTESAMKEKEICRDKLQGGLTQQGLGLANLSLPTSVKRDKHNLANMELHMEKLTTSSVTTIKLSSRKHISPVVFYGSPHGVPAKRPSQLLRLLREIRVDLTEQNDLNLRKEVWATFPKQDQAVTFAKTHEQVHVFSYQDHLNGQRRFLVSTYEEFWRRYKNMDSKFRHHYEVIQEGLPCHLYFDLEFSRKVNPEKNGEEMVNLLISVIFEALYDKYCIQADEEWIIELDSSTEEKFSRHMIIRLPGAAFKDNSHAGAFISEICSRITCARGCDPRLDKLYILKDSGGSEVPHQLFLDSAVYSRNRCFRLALSSKAGKSSVLLPTGRFKCKNMSDQQMFMESLICRMDSDCKKLLICKMDLDCMKTLHFDSEVNRDHEQNFEALKNLRLNSCTSDFPGTYLTGKSPFSALDMFVESIASTGNLSGRIRSWYWFSEYGLMVYSMSRNRYCERIGREHKSNHGYRSPLRPIPRDIIPIDMAVYNLTRTESYGHHTYLNKVTNESPNDCAKITESCRKDGWWFEAIRATEEIEKMRKSPKFCNLFQQEDDMGFIEDHQWWMDAEKTASLVEKGTYSQLLDHGKQVTSDVKC